MNLKFALYIAGVVLGALLFALVLHWKHEAARVPDLERDIATMTKAFDAERALRTREETRHTGIVQGLNDELATLKADRARRPARAIRVCNDAPLPAARVPAAEPAPGASDGNATTGAGALHESPGRDIGPEVYALMDEANDQLAGFRALRQWAATLPKCAPVSP